MGNEIYCYGGIDIYNAVFNAIAMMNGDRSFMQSLVAVGVLVGGFWTMVTLIFGDFIKPFLHWIIPMAVLQAAFLTPTATVQLVDVVQEGRHEVVDNVPYGLALIAGSLSRISQRITEKTELYFHSVNDIKYSKTGGIFAANLVGNQKLMKIQDEDFADNMRSFIGQCVLYDLALGRKYTMKQLRNTHDIWGLISANASPARSFMWKERGNRGDILTCAEGVQKFTDSWDAHIDQTACAVGAKMYPNHDANPYTGGVQGRSFYRTGTCKSPLARTEFIKFLPFQYAALAGIGQQAPEILKQQMMISAIVDAQDHASAVVGNMPNFAARKAYFQQRSSYENIGLLAADTLPIMRAVLELICYAIFLFIVPILVLPMGYKVLISWTQTVLWLAMWPPMYAVLHLIMVSAIAMKTKAFVGISNSAGITIASSLGVQNISADMAAMAGYLSMSIPFICIAVVKGVSSFVHMAGSLGAVSQGAATSAATEALTGNYSLGNSSMDNHSFGNMNQLSQSYNSSLSTGNTSLQEGHSTYATDAHGNMVAKEQRHDLGVSVNMAKSLSDQKRMSAVQEQSMGQSLTQSSENILSSAVEKMGNFGKTLSNSTTTQEGFTEQQQQDAGKSYQVLQNSVEKFAQTHDISTGKAAQVMAQAGTPGLGFFGFGVSANTSSSSSDNKLIQSAKDFAKQHNLEETGRTAEQATKHLSKNSTDDNVQSYLQSQQASVTEAAHQSQSAQKRFERSDRLMQEADRVDSNALNINRDATEDYVKWLKNQPGVHSNGGNFGAMGDRAAINVLRDPVQGSIYESQYMREHMSKQGSGISESSLKQKYEKAHIPSSVDNGVIDNLDMHAKKQITSDIAQKADGIEKRVESKWMQTESAYASVQTKMSEQSTQLEAQYKQDKEKVGITEAAMQGVGAVIDGGADIVSKGVQFVADNSDVLAAANPFMMNHPSQVMQHPHQSNSELSSEPIQKIVKISQVVDAPEADSIDLNQRKNLRVTNKG